MDVNEVQVSEYRKQQMKTGSGGGRAYGTGIQFPAVQIYVEAMRHLSTATCCP